MSDLTNWQGPNGIGPNKIGSELTRAEEAKWCAQLLLQLYADSFEASHVFWSWSKTCMWFRANTQICCHFLSLYFKHYYY